MMASNSSKHEGLRMSSPPARMCDASSPKRRLLPPADQPLLFARPASVHFGGFALGQCYEQRVRVHNNSAKPVRLRFVLPAKGFARAAFARERRPFVPAGLSEELVVTFTPSAFQYHYDCIQVRAEEVAYASNTDTVLLGSCVVPIHAYPVLNDVRFPSRMDFGAVPSGGVGRRQFDLTCSVPIEFEYELELAKAHPSFTVFPLKGVIPANGSARIELEFRPLVFATASAEVVLHVSQFGFTPMTCVLAGSSSPSDVQQTDAVPAGGEKASESSPSRRAKTPSAAESRSGSSPTKPSRESKPRRPKASGHSNNDSGKDGSATQPVAVEKIGGLEIPTDLSSMASVNFILTQQPGKLKPKDLKRAVEASRELRKRQKDEQAKLSATSGSDDLSATSATGEHQTLALTFQVLVREEENFLKRKDVSRQIKEMFFAQELSEMDQSERELEYQSHKIHVGDELLTPQQLALLEQMRTLNSLELERQQREKQRNRFTTEAFNAQSQPTPETPDPPRGMLPAHYTSEYAPDFKTYKNDLWARRKRVVQRFVRAVSACVVRARAQRRLEKIRKWLGGSRTRAQVRERVALDWQRHGVGGGGDTNSREAVTSSSTTQDNQSFFFESFPLVDDKSHTPREFIAQPADWELKFDSFTFLPLRERDEALLSGHEPLELPPLPTYVRLESERELRVGAADECGGPRSLLGEQEPTDSASIVPQQETRTASLLQQVSPDIFLRPSASVRPLARIQSPRETDPSYVLRPQRVFRTPPTNFESVQEQSVGTRSLVALKDSMLALSSVCLPSTERPRAQPLLCPVSLATEDTQTEDQELFRDVWFISQRPSTGIPQLAACADEVPCLSDSESDDDDESKRKKCPTWEDAEQLFESEGDNHTEVQKAAHLEEGELLGRANGVFSFERYRHLIRLERAYNNKREALLQLLPNVRVGLKALCELSVEMLTFLLLV